MKLRFAWSRQRTIATITLFGILNCIMLAGTWAFTVYFRNLAVPWEAAPNVKLLFMQFNLGVENVLASWYSSMLLLVIGVGCLLCWLADRKSNPSSRWLNINLGWLCLSILFFGLSLDELGSIHERLGEIFPVTREGLELGWEYLLLLPIIVVGLLMLAFACVHFSKKPAVLALMIVGIGLFLSIPLQEKIEQDAWREVGRAELWERPLGYVLLEEGSELFGMLCFLAATALYLSRRTDPTVLQVRVTGARVAVVAIAFLGVCALGLPIVSYLSQQVPQSSHGFAQNWFPSFLALINAIICWQIASQKSEGKSTPYWWSIAALFLILSAYFGANLHNYRFWLGTHIGWQLLHWAAALLILSLGMLLAAGTIPNKMKIVPLGGALLIAWSLIAATAWIELAAAVGFIGVFTGLLLGSSRATVPQVAQTAVQKINIASP